MKTDKLQDPAEEDRALLQRVQRCLDQCGYASLRSLEISVERGVVLIQGRVPTFYLRQIAIGCIMRAACASQVVDRIEVVDAPNQCQPSADEDAEQEPSEPWLGRRMDLPDMALSAGDVFPHIFLVGIRSGQHAEKLINRMGLFPLIAQKVAELRRLFE